MHGLIRTGVAAAATFAVLVFPGAGLTGGPPVLVWSPTTSSGTYDHGAVGVGETSSQTFTLSNRGRSATGRLSVALSPPPSARLSKSFDAERARGPASREKAPRGG
jgi:hypothetical protein